MKKQINKKFLSEGYGSMMRDLANEKEDYVNAHPDYFMYETDDLEEFDTLEDAIAHAKKCEDCTEIKRVQISYEEDGPEYYDEIVWEKVKENLKEQKLNEGTSNFGWVDPLPLLVFYTYDEVLYSMDNDDENPRNHPDDYASDEELEDAFEEWEQEYFDKVDVCILDEYDVDELEKDLGDLNGELKSLSYELYDKASDLEYDEGGYEAHKEEVDHLYDQSGYLEDVASFGIESGYYSAAYIDCDGNRYIEDLDDEYKNLVFNKINEIKKKYGLTELEVAWGPASNGETGYRKVNESKKKRNLKESINEDDGYHEKIWYELTFEDGSKDKDYIRPYVKQGRSDEEIKEYFQYYFDDKIVSIKQVGWERDDNSGVSFRESSYRGLAYYEYPKGSGCHVRETPEVFVAISESGKTLGQDKMKTGAETIIDEYLKKKNESIEGTPKKDDYKKLAKKHQKTNKKGARGTFERVANTDPKKNMEIFNHMMGSDVPASGEASVGVTESRYKNDKTNFWTETREEEYDCNSYEELEDYMSTWEPWNPTIEYWYDEDEGVGHIYWEESSYTDISDEKMASLDSDITVRELLDMWWNSVRVGGDGFEDEAILYKDSEDGSYELDEDNNPYGEKLLDMVVHTNAEWDEDGDGFPIVYATYESKDEQKDEPLKEAPISGSGNLLSYITEAKNILANVKELIKQGKSSSSIFDLIQINMKEDNIYNIEHYIRKGENLNKLFSIYGSCIKEFTNAFPKEKTKINELNNLLSEMKKIADSISSTKENLNKEKLPSKLKESRDEERIKYYQDKLDKIGATPEEIAKVIKIADDYESKAQRHFITYAQMDEVANAMGLKEMSDKELARAWDLYYYALTKESFSDEEGSLEKWEKYGDAASAFAEVINREARERKAKGNYKPKEGEPLNLGEIIGNDFMVDSEGLLYLSKNTMANIVARAKDIGMSFEDLMKQKFEATDEKGNWGSLRLDAYENTFKDLWGLDESFDKPKENNESFKEEDEIKIKKQFLKNAGYDLDKLSIEEVEDKIQDDWTEEYKVKRGKGLSAEINEIDSWYKKLEKYLEFIKNSQVKSESCKVKEGKTLSNKKIDSIVKRNQKYLNHIKIKPNSKAVEIEIPDKSKVGDEGHPIQKGLTGRAGKLEGLKEAEMHYDIDYVKGPEGYAKKMDKVGNDLNSVKEKYGIETSYDGNHKYYNFVLDNNNVTIVFSTYNHGFNYDFSYALVNDKKLDNEKLSQLETERGGSLGDYYDLEPTINAIKKYLEVNDLVQNKKRISALKEYFTGKQLGELLELCKELGIEKMSEIEKIMKENNLKEDELLDFLKDKLNGSIKKGGKC